MKSEKLLDAIGHIDEKYIEESEVINSKKWLIGIAAVICLLAIVPNTNAKLASAMAEIPLLGQVFEVITIRTYQSEEVKDEMQKTVPDIVDQDQDQEEQPIIDDPNKPSEEVQQDIEILVPEINSQDQEDHLVIDNFNQSVESYTEMVLASIPENVRIAVDSDYQVITNTDTWFTLVIQVTEIQASGYSYNKYFHIDKAQHEMKILGDLFKDKSYQDLIINHIKELMAKQMVADESIVYFPDHLRQLPEDQGFYFNEEEQLVLVFNEYDVAPGYMGIVEFIIEPSVLEDLWR